MAENHHNLNQDTIKIIRMCSGSPQLIEKCRQVARIPGATMEKRRAAFQIPFVMTNEITPKGVDIDSVDWQAVVDYFRHKKNEGIAPEDF